MKYIYQGPPTGVTFGRGKNTRSVPLRPGREVELDEANGWVKSSVAKGLLVPVAKATEKKKTKDGAVEQKPAPPVVEQPKATEPTKEMK